MSVLIVEGFQLFLLSLDYSLLPWRLTALAVLGLHPPVLCVASAVICVLPPLISQILSSAVSSPLMSS